MKFQPITPKNKAANILANPIETTLFRNGLKNNKLPIANKPVLTIGNNIDAIIAPKVSFLFLNNLKTKPETNPAKEDFKMHKKIVAIGFIGINMARVDGEKTTAIPLTAPRKKPANGPYKIAPIAIGIRHKFMLTGPKVMKLPAICKTTSIAVNTPTAAIFFVENDNFFFNKVPITNKRVIATAMRPIMNLIQLFVVILIISSFF